MSAGRSDFFVTGGALASDAASYVVRHADADLRDALAAGEFCYVLTARQMGKSSLMVRTVTDLRQREIDAVVVDLTAIGVHITVDHWYRGLLAEVGEQLGLDAALDAAWARLQALPPIQRWLRILREVVVASRARPLVIFIDEIDIVRSLPFRTDDFFAGLRELFNRRARDPDLRRLTFCLLGVASPTDLIADPTLTPFNVGRRIELADFTLDEALVLAPGLGRPPATAQTMLRRVVHWTGAHPYLTQRLCQAVARDAGAASDADVDRLCHQLFLSPHAAERDDNLIFVREHLLSQDGLRTPLLDLYGAVLRGDRAASAGDDRVNPVAGALHLSGIVRTDGGRLRVRNEIYARVFDRAWVSRHLPDAEIRRQRVAFRRGVLRASAIAATVLALMLGGVAVLLHQRTLLRAEQARSQMLLYAAEMNLAAQAWDVAAAARTRTLLEHHIPAAGEPDLRGFEWFYLWRLVNGDAARLQGHVRDPTRVAFAPDGTRVAVGGWSGLIDIWNLDAKQVVLELGDRGKVGLTSLSFSPDGRSLVSTGAPDWILIHDAATGVRLRELRGHTGHVRDAAFSPDGRLLATASFDRTIRLWDPGDGHVVGILEGHTGGVNAVQFSPDGMRLASASWDNTVRVWDVRSRREIGQLAHQQDVETLTFTPDGRRLITGGWEGRLSVWDAHTLQRIGTLDGHHTLVPSILCAPQGGPLASAGRDGTIRLWDVESRREIARVRPNALRSLAIAFSPDGRRLVSAADEGELRVWPVEPSGRVEQEAVTLEGHAAAVTGLLFLPDDRTLISTSEDKTARLWSLPDRATRSIWPQHGFANIGNLSPDGQRVIIEDDATGVSIWDIASGQPVTTMRTDVRLRSALFTPDGRLVTSDGTRITLWDAAIKTRLVEQSVFDVGSMLAVSPDGALLVTGNNNGIVRFWTLGPGTLTLAKETKAHTDLMSGFAFSPDGRTMASASFDGAIRLWDWHMMTPQRELRGHQGWVTSAVFSPDGRRLASGGLDGVIKFWDVTSGQELVTLHGHTDVIHALAFSHDGRVLASASRDRTIRLWRAAPMSSSTLPSGR